MDNAFWVFCECVGVLLLYLLMFAAAIIVPREDAEKAEPVSAWNTNPVVIPIPRDGR